MRVAFEDEADGGWRPRGRPRKEIPAQVRELADRTYRTEHVGRVTVQPGEEEEAHALELQLKRYAKGRGLWMTIQWAGNVMRCKMTDPPPGAKTAESPRP